MSAVGNALLFVQLRCAVDKMTWVTSWEAWRTATGRRGSRHRAEVDRFLETHPAVLYWGDSWFSTPLYLNLARQSAKRISGIGMVIGKPGAEAVDLFSRREVDRLCKRIESNPFDIVCLSAGGNDCLDDRLGTIFSDWQGKSPKRSDVLDALRAYQWMVDSGAFTRVRESYDRLLQRLRAVQRQRPHLQVIGQPYVPIELIGEPADLTTDNIGLIAWIKGRAGPWLWNRMQPVLGDKQQAHEFARLMLMEGFGKLVLNALEAAHPGLFSVVDFSATDLREPRKFWHDEIHPTEAGFEKLAIPFNAQIRKRLPHAKQHAVR